MAQYRYTAKDMDGNTVKGIAEAASEEALYDTLRAEGKYLVDCRKKGGDKSGYSKIKTPVVADFCRQLGTLLAAGVSLVRTLNIIAGEADLKPKYAKVYRSVQEAIIQGISLSEAMEQQGRAFPVLLINMIRSAETNGNIDVVALRMANHYEKENRLNTKVKNAMIYPAVLMVLLFGAAAFILIFIMPQFEDMFAEMESLPLITRMLMGMSDAFQKYWYLIIIVIVAVIGLFKWLFTIPAAARLKDQFKLHIPIVGKLLRKIYTARFARTLSSLYGSGITIVNALPIAADTIGNAYIESQFEKVSGRVRMGEPLSRVLRDVKGFQNKLAASIMVGEETGSLDDMLDSIAESLDYEAEKALERLVALLEPVLIILMAVVVGFVVVAVILPIYQSYSTIEQGY